MPPLRIGIIGAQFAAHLHLHNYKPLRGSKVEILAVASRTKESAEAFANRFGIPQFFDDYRRLLDREDIDAVDICVPSDLHHEFVILAAGAIRENRVKFCYAENWVYAPPVAKLKNLIKVSKGTVMDIRGEESHSGSHAAYSRKWKYAGGGALLRLGAHPVSAVLHLKAYEGKLKGEKGIGLKSVTAEVGRHTLMESFRKEPKKWIVSAWEDVEDWATMIMNFEDGSQAVVTASDGVLGGVRNTMTVYMSNAVVQVNINPSDTVVAYAPEPHIFGDEYIAEKLETKAGWNFASPDEDWVRGYPQELEDFADCILMGKEPVSGVDLAIDTVKAIYAGYLSAEQGMRVELDKILGSGRDVHTKTNEGGFR
jgi:predicted dehydrogenase